jgi:glutamate synthase (NADPH/NADH) small chain
MDQKELRELENRCIQDEPPECTAACPIHVDARAFIGQMGRGAWAEAWKVLQKTMPFPGILGRICDAPCQERCRRGEVDQAIAVHLLERACVETPPPPRRIQPLTGKGRTVAVVGSDLSSLTVAWDLVRKGYGLTLFESGQRLGGGLLVRPEEILPRRVVEEETAFLAILGVVIKLGSPARESDWAAELRRHYDAVYLGLEGFDPWPWGLDQDADGRLKVEPRLQQTSRVGVFAGGRPRPAGGFSPIWQVTEGRWAATSIDRYLQKVSPTAGREKDGPYRTRLFTNLDKVMVVPMVQPANPLLGYTPEEARPEAQRCLQCECLECVKVCLYLERFGSYPRKYAREIYNNDSIVMGARQGNRLINSCSLCGLCEAVCPEDFAMQDLCLQARRAMVQKGKMPPSAHEFALLDMQFSNSDRFALARHEPGKTSSEQVFFPGCQLSASSPKQVQRLYDYLRRILPGGVGLMLGCCSAPASWAGQDNLYQAELARWRGQWEHLGCPQVILACSTCFQMLKPHLPGDKIVSLWQILESHGLPEGLPAPIVSGELAVHDPCTTRQEIGFQTSVRRLLDKLACSVEELPLNREFTECCGFGGLMQNANPELAKAVVRRRAAASEKDYVTYCAVCRDNLAAVGKRVVHLLDLILPEESREDPADRPRPSWSQRQENRARLKEAMIEELWLEVSPAMKDQQKIVLHISDEVQLLLEDRRILVEDLQQVIHQAETTGQKLLQESSGHYKASYTPFKATFWVEYSPHQDGFIVHNAYSHRMEVSSGGR